MVCIHLWCLITLSKVYKSMVLKKNHIFRENCHKVPILRTIFIRKKSFSQVSDASLSDSSGDGFHSCADGVEQVGQFTCSMGLPALLQNKPGEGQDIGIESRFVRHLPSRRGTGT